MVGLPDGEKTLRM